MSRKWKHCKKNNKDLGKYVEIIWSAWIPSQNSYKDFLFQQCTHVATYIGCKTNGIFFVSVDVLSKT